MSKHLPLLAMALGVTFILLAVVYLFIPANHLPSFVPGFDPDMEKVHYKHGLLALAVGILLVGVTWPSSRKQ